MTFEDALKLVPLCDDVKVYVYNNGPDAHKYKSDEHGKIWVEGIVTSVEIREAHGEKWAVVNAVYDEPIDGRRGYHAGNIEKV